MLNVMESSKYQRHGSNFEIDNPYPNSRFGKNVIDENIDLHKILEKRGKLHSQRVSDVYAAECQTMRDNAASPYSSIKNQPN